MQSQFHFFAAAAWAGMASSVWMQHSAALAPVTFIAQAEVW
jgi:hypothetical protein